MSDNLHISTKLNNDTEFNIENFRFHLPLRVHFADTDAQRVVYYGNYFTYFEAGRQEYFRKLGITLTDLQQQGYEITIAEVNCKYLSPARYDDLLNVYVRVNGLRESSFIMEHLVDNRTTKKLVAFATAVMVFVDKNTWKSVSMPEWFKNKINEFEKL